MNKFMNTTAIATIMGAASLGLLAAPAYSNPLAIGIGSTPVTAASQNNPLPQILTTSGTTGSFSYSITASVDQEPDLLSQTLDISSGAAGTLYVWVSSLNNFPLAANWLSSFTANQIPAGWSVQEFTYVFSCTASPCPTGNFYSTTDELATHSFSAIGTNVQLDTASPALTAPFGVTEEFIITATGAGTSNDTIDLTPVPEPASLTILGAALVGLGVIRRRRKSV